MIRDHDVATPALLCHKEPALIIGPFRAWKPQNHKEPARSKHMGLFGSFGCAGLDGSLWHKRAGVATL